MWRIDSKHRKGVWTNVTQCERDMGMRQDRSSWERGVDNWANKKSLWQGNRSHTEIGHMEKMTETV